MRILIVPNVDNPRAADAARVLVTWAREQGHEALFAPADAVALGLEGMAADHAALEGTGLAVALGGDGTVLKAVHVLSGLDRPVLGINLGRLGFLSAAEGDHLVDAVGRAASGQGTLERRSTLDILVYAGGREGGSHVALNEVYVGRGPGGRAVEVAVDIAGERLMCHVCDGIIVSTPTGSTAYSLSAGGPLVSPAVRAALVVPVCAHTLTARPVVTAPGETISLTLPEPARSGACVTVDGELVPCRSPLDRVDVSVGQLEVTLVRLDGRGFYGALAETFIGG